MTSLLPFPTQRPHPGPVETIVPPKNASDAITAKYNSLGGAGGVLGTDVLGGIILRVSGRDGWYSSSRNGEIYWFPEFGAVAIYGSIYRKWKSAGSGKSPVGFPVSDVMLNAGPASAYQTFTAGAISILGGSATDLGGQPVMIYGYIYSKWLSLGGWRSGIGVPTIDESATPDGASRYSTFSNGAAIYWTESAGAHVVSGGIYTKYLELGGERSFLGYPLTDELPGAGGRYNDFSGGFIFYSPVTGRTHEVRGGLPSSVDFVPQQHTFGEGVALGGSSHVTVFSDGQTQFEGQFHDSGAVAYDISVAAVLADANKRGYSFGTTGHVAGTFEPGSRDFFWSTPGTNRLISENWRAIVADHMVYAQASESMDLSSLLSSIATIASIRP